MKSNLLKLLALTSLLIILCYVFTRTCLFFFIADNTYDKVLSIIFLLAEFFILAHTFGFTLIILKVLTNKNHTPLHGDFPPLKKEPGVAILVAARHEPKAVLQQTFLSLKNLEYKNKNIYFLDDSSDEKYKKEAEELCKTYKLNLFRRETRHGAKAGIINDCFKTLSEKYVVIFDADQCPLPEFLKNLVPMIENNPKLAFIQTPQYYSNMDESRVARGAAFQQSIFYEYICEGKNTTGAMICCGTNIIFRRKALAEVGGLDESSVTEDFATSVQLHYKGWQSLYYDHVNTFGMGPENLTGYFKQQFRWASGTLSIFKKLIWQFLIHPRKLKLFQWFDYFLSSSFYFVGFSFCCLMLFPVHFIFFNRPSFFNMPTFYFLAFIPYIAISLFLFLFAMKFRNYKIKDICLGQLLGICAFTVYMRAGFRALLGLKAEFGITEKSNKTALPYSRLWPQMLFLFINFIAFVWGINRFIYEQNAAIAMNGMWTLYHFGVLSSLFYFNQTGETSDIIAPPLKATIKSDLMPLNESSAKSPALDKSGWGESFTLHLPNQLKTDTLLMAKLSEESKSPIIFDAKVLWSSKKKKRKGFKTIIGVTTITGKDRQALKKMIS